MMSQEGPGLLRRVWTVVGRALERGILGKSGHAYSQQFTGSDEYWDRVIAAQLGWPEKLLPQPEKSKGPLVLPRRVAGAVLPSPAPSFVRPRNGRLP
jgi:hypothetical protein